METLDPVLRSLLCRALGRAAEALDRVPESALTPGWIRAHGRPAMAALSEAAQFLEQRPPTRPAPTVLILGSDQTSPLPVTPTSVIKLACPHPGGCVASSTWNPFGERYGRYEPKRPSVPIIRQLATALIDKLGRPLAPTELKIALREAVSCSQPTATRQCEAPSSRARSTPIGGTN